MLIRLNQKYQRGLSLVELMVGITIGLIVTASASMVAVNQINEHRRLMLETQVQQDLRAAADLIQQDIRRAGFRGNAQLGVFEPASGDGTAAAQVARNATENVYSSVTKTEDSQSITLQYSYAKVNADGFFDNAAAPAGNEYFGIKWDRIKKTLSLRLGLKDGVSNWQPITDPEIVEITHFDVEIFEQSVDLKNFCDTACVGTACPVQKIRRVDFQIRGQATPRVSKDLQIVRTLSGSERIRADAISGSCPA